MNFFLPPKDKEIHYTQYINLPHSIMQIFNYTLSKYLELTEVHRLSVCGVLRVYEGECMRL